MNPAAILTALRLPARLDSQAAAAFLGVQEHDLPVLARAKLLKPLGNPAPNAPKYYATCELEDLARNRAWLAKATVTLAQNWRRKNTLREPGNRPAANGRNGAGVTRMEVTPPRAGP